MTTTDSLTRAYHLGQQNTPESHGELMKLVADAQQASEPVAWLLENPPALSGANIKTITRSKAVAGRHNGIPLFAAEGFPTGAQLDELKRSAEYRQKLIDVGLIAETTPELTERDRVEILRVVRSIDLATDDKEG